MKLQIQADAIRVAILYKYGGFWIDIDTIIINHNFIDIFKNSSLYMFGDSKQKGQHIGFIYASNKSKIIRAWLDGIIKNVNIYKKNKPKIKFSYLGNGILDNLIEKSPEKEFKRIDRNNVYALPDQQLLHGPRIQRYIKFYFSSSMNFNLLKKCKGVLLLHNSWTPKKYKIMSEKEFLNQNIFLAKFLSYILAQTRL